jgi:hypothetical protein
MHLHAEHKAFGVPALRGPQHRARTHASPPASAGRTVESREKESTVACPWDAGSERLGSGPRALPLAAPPPPPRAPPVTCDVRRERAYSLAERAAVMHR